MREASAYGYRIQVSADGRSWRTVAAPAGAKGRTVTAFYAVKARYVRLQFADPSPLDLVTGARPAVNDLEARA